METGHQKPTRDLRLGERILALTGGGELVFSEVLAFLDRDPAPQKLFYTLRTESGARLSLTAAHLLFVTESNCSEEAEPVRGAAALRTVYAGDARPGQCLLVSEGAGRLSRISRVGVRAGRGVYAPLTEQGTLVVDGVVASCYAAVNAHSLAHRAFWPLRLLHGRTGSSGPAPRPAPADGLHWYPRLLHRIGTTLLDPGRFQPLGVSLADR